MCGEYCPAYLAVDADAACQHGDDVDTVLPDHLPEVGHSVRQWSLSGDVPELITANLHLLTNTLS